MKIEYMAVDTLRKYANNTKEHTPEQVREIAKSIERFGFRQPIAVDSNHVIVIGHGRLMAAKQLRLKEVPVTVIDDLSPDEVNALRLVDNRLNESAWDFSALEAELADIDGIDMTDFGFEPISDETIQYATRPPETASERGWHEDKAEYPAQHDRGEYRHVAGADNPRVDNPATHTTPLQATARDRREDWVEEQGMRLVGERSLIEADGGMEYRYVCPRCKHRFN